MATAWLDGSLVDEANACVPIANRGLLHGEGVFTTMRARRQQVIRLDKHLQRLRSTCNALLFPLPHSDPDLVAAVRNVLEANQLAEARLRLTITKGPARDGANSATAFLTAAVLEPYPAELYERGMTVALLDEQKLNPFDIQAGHKTLNYFSRIAGLRHAQQAACGEALWFNIFNYLQSGSISNVFIIKAGQLITPPTQPEIDADAYLREKLPYARSNVLPGITRAAVLELAQSMGIEIGRTSINVEQLLDADEIFLTNSIMNIMPVSRIERSVVGNDKPGEITRQLSEALSAE